MNRLLPAPDWLFIRRRHRPHLLRRLVVGTVALGSLSGMVAGQYTAASVGQASGGGYVHHAQDDSMARRHAAEVSRTLARHFYQPQRARRR